MVLTSPWLSPLVVPLAALALLRIEKTFQAACGFAAPRLAIARLRRVCDRRVVAVDPSDRPLLDTRVAGAGAAGRRGGVLEHRALVAMALRGLLLAGLAANFLVAAAGPGNAWFVPLAKLRNDPGGSDPWHR